MKPYDLIESNCNFKISQYFVKNWERFLDNCEKLLKTDLIKPDDLLTILNWHQPFILKSNFNCETSNLICAINSSWCNNKHIGPTAGQLKERLSFYRKHIRQREYDKIEVEKIYAHVQTEYLNFFPFFKMKENNKILRKCCENNLIKKFKLELNRRLWNTKNWRQFQKVTWMNFRKNNCSK